MKHRTIIQTVVRPKKVAVLVPYDMNEDGFRDIIEFLGWLWGGKYSCIVPFDPADLENKVGMAWLTTYSPDVIYFAENSCTNEWQKRIEKEVAPFISLALQHPLEKNLHINFANVLSRTPVATAYAKEIHALPDITTKFQFLSTNPNVENRIFYDLSFGVCDKETADSLGAHLKGSSHHITSGGIPDYIRLHDNDKSPFSYLDITGLELTPS